MNLKTETIIIITSVSKVLSFVLERCGSSESRIDAISGVLIVVLVGAEKPLALVSLWQLLFVCITVHGVLMLDWLFFSHCLHYACGRIT